MTFSPDELSRYARHIVLREIGGPGQQKLKAATVAVIGAGGLGAPALLYLAAAGVGCLRIIDDDTVDLSNLQRQVLFSTDQIGAPKTTAAAETLKALNPNVEVDVRAERLTPVNAVSMLDDCDIVLDGSDSFETRAAANAAAVHHGLPLIAGAIAQWEGQIGLYHPATGAPCYGCVFPKPPSADSAPSCAEAGVMGPLPGVIGAMMAGETLKALTGAGQTLAGRLLIFDALWGETRTIKVNRRPGCAVCGAQ